MTKRLSLLFLMLTIPAGQAQVASHAPTIRPQSPDRATTPATTPALANKPVVRVNGAVLTDVDLLREEYAIFPYARQHGGIPQELASQIRDGAMKMMVFEELVYQEAQHRKMTLPAAKLDRAEADFHKQFATEEEFKEFLQSDFRGSRQLLREKISRSLLIDSLLKLEVEDKCTVSPADVKGFYDKNLARFQHPESFTFQTISFLPPANAAAAQGKESRAKADRALVQAKATKNAEQFGLLAEKLSEDDFRVMMGQHKPVPVSELAPQVVKALLAMHPGDVSDVIQVDQAYTILRLQAHTPAGADKFDLIQRPLAKQLQDTKRNQLRAAFDKKLRQNAKVEQL